MAEDGSVPTTPKRKREDETDDEKSSDYGISSDSNETGEKEEDKSSDSNGKGVKEEDKSSDIDIDSDDSEYELEDGSKADPLVLSKYFQQVHASEGFDIEDFPGVCGATGIVPLIGGLMTPKNYKDVSEHAKLAISKYNEENDEAYEYNDFVKANLSCCAGYIYYITFSVKNLKAGDEAPLELFQAYVWHGITESKVEFCRPKPNKVENQI